MRYLLVLGIAVTAYAQADSKKPASGVDHVRINEAIERGVDFLKRQGSDLRPFGGGAHEFRLDELVLWTLLHAGVPREDESIQGLLETILESKLEKTYLVSLQAMILEEMDRAVYQLRIAQCAQFLADNQAENGQWHYGEPSIYAEEIATRSRKDVATPGAPKAQASMKTQTEKPKVKRRITVKKMRQGPRTGDNSNSQYAALGLRACFNAGVDLPREIILLAKRWWEQACTSNGGWGYMGRDDRSSPSGSMTAGAVGSLCIYGYMLGQRWQQLKEVKAGVQWLTKNFTVEKNPGARAGGPGPAPAPGRPQGPDPGQGPPPGPGQPPAPGPGVVQETWHYYYLYALERAGILSEVEKFGTHDWYAEGARWLLDHETRKGEWGNGVVDTCFAVLFLRQATEPLRAVATHSSKSK